MAAATNRAAASTTRVYVDGCFDMFHVGHLRSFGHCHDLAEHVTLIVGVIGDDVAADYKRRPIISLPDRADIVEAIALVSEVIRDPPLVMTDSFLREHRIDLVAHAFCNAADAQKQDHCFQVARERGIFRTIPYTRSVSTTAICQKIKGDRGESSPAAKPDRARRTL